jgi:hypothetical protein
MRFVTPIKHANVNPHGRICHSVLDGDWTVETSLHDVLSCVYGLLLTPETSDPVDTHLVQLYFKRDGTYDAAILAHVQAHATKKSLAEWKAELGGADDEEQGQGQGQAAAGGDSGPDSQPLWSKRLRGGREQDEKAHAVASGDSEGGGESQPRRSTRRRGGP